MTFKEDYLKFLNKKIIDILKANNIDDINVSIHDEFYYEKKANVDVTVKFLPGQIQSGIIQYPAEIFLQIEEQYKDNVIDAFNDYISYYNETVETFGNETFKQFYTLPSILSAFQNGATKRIVTAQISLSLFAFKNLAGIKQLVIDGENISFINTAMSLVTEQNSSGGLNGIETKSITELVSRTLTFTYVPKIVDSTNSAASIKFMEYLFKDSIINSTPVNYNTSLSVTIKSIITEDTTFTANWIVKQLDFAQEINGFPTLTVSLIRRV